jgi:large conductance mechanosensitive channel
MPFTPDKARSTWTEFRAFLMKQNALALAIGVVIGAALNDIVKALVDGIIMPVVGLIMPKDASWQTYTLAIGESEFLIGRLAAAVINFLIIGLVVWRITKVLIKPKPPEAKAPTKQCPFCVMEIDSAATRCAYCTSQLA